MHTGVPEFVVHPPFLDELLVSARLCDSSLVDVEDGVCSLDGGEPVGNGYRGTADLGGIQGVLNYLEVW